MESIRQTDTSNNQTDNSNNGKIFPWGKWDRRPILDPPGGEVGFTGIGDKLTAEFAKKIIH